MIRHANASGIPICIEPVSVSKAKKIADMLNGIDYITPNRDELEVLSGMPVSDANLENAARALIKRGVKNVLVTLGEKGMYLIHNEGSRFYESFSVAVTDVTGAGDSLTAGFIYGLMKHSDPHTACRCGLAAAAITVGCKETVSSALTEENLIHILFSPKT